MIQYECDGCGVILARNALRYTVTIEVKAAYDEIEVRLADLIKDHRSEILRLIERLRHRDPNEVEEQIYKKAEYDLCPTCHRAYLRNPLRFHPEIGPAEGAVDIDGFLRSLGFGETRDEGDDS